MIKKINLRNPYFIKAEDTNLHTANLKLYIYTGEINVRGTLKYSISKTELGTNNYVVFEISELVRDYLEIEFNNDYASQVVFVSYDLDIINSSSTTLYTDSDVFIAADGYSYFEEGLKGQENLLDNINKISSWTLSENNITIDEDNATAPNGTTTATKLQSGGGFSFAAANFTELGNYTFSVFAKAGNVNYIALRAPDSNQNIQYFDILNGTVGTTNGADIEDARIQSYGSGWFKCEIDLSIDDSSPNDVYLIIANSDGDQDSTANDIIYVWNPRFESTKSTYNVDLSLLSNTKLLINEDESFRFPVYDNSGYKVKQYTGASLTTTTVLSGFTNTNSAFDYLTIPATITKIEITKTDDTVLNTFTIEPICEAKFEVIKVTFVNKYGAFQDLYFFKKSTESTDVMAEEYKSTIIDESTLSYKTYRHQKTRFLVQGQDSITMNTGFVNDELNKAIEELMISEQVYMTRNSVVYPLVPKTKSVTYQTSLNDRLANYTIDFDMAFDKINDIR